MDDGELTIGFKEEEGFVLSYFENEFPLSYLSWHLILNAIPASSFRVELERAAATIEESHFHEGAAVFEKLYHDDTEVKTLVGNSLQLINDDRERLQNLISEQRYLPVYWKESERRINYRRFFTINGHDQFADGRPSGVCRIS